jgi:acyl-coenzyme A synthetase/AMP-(fatty) acid ligase
MAGRPVCDCRENTTVSGVAPAGKSPRGGNGFNEFVDSARSELEVSPWSAGDLAIGGYPSGTTGLPKGAMISQEALDGTGGQD